MKFFTTIGIIVITFISIFGLYILFALPTWWAWNEFLPHIFHLPRISYLDALALNILAGLFKQTSMYMKKENNE